MIYLIWPPERTILTSSYCFIQGGKKTQLQLHFCWIWDVDSGSWRQRVLEYNEILNVTYVKATQCGPFSACNFDAIHNPSTQRAPQKTKGRDQSRCKQIGPPLKRCTRADSEPLNFWFIQICRPNPIFLSFSQTCIRWNSHNMNGSF